MRGTGGGELSLGPEYLRARGSDVEREEAMRDGSLWSMCPLGETKEKRGGGFFLLPVVARVLPGENDRGRKHRADFPG